MGHSHLYLTKKGLLCPTTKTLLALPEKTCQALASKMSGMFKNGMLGTAREIHDQVNFLLGDAKTAFQIHEAVEAALEEDLEETALLLPPKSGGDKPTHRTRIEGANQPPHSSYTIWLC